MEGLKLIFVIGSALLFVGLPTALITLYFQSKKDKIKKEERIEQLKITEQQNIQNKKKVEEREREKHEKEEEIRHKISKLEVEINDLKISAWNKFKSLDSPTNIETMKGIEFEKIVGKLFVSMGYKVTFTSVNNDQGADLLAEKDNDKTAIQTKRYKKNVGNSAVQEVIAGSQFHGCNKTCVVTNSNFTKSAKQLAKRSNTELIDREKLFFLFEQHSKNEKHQTYNENIFIKKQEEIFSFFPRIRESIKLLERKIHSLDNSYYSKQKTDLPLKPYEKKEKPSKCPKCGSQQIADILYGMPASYSEAQEKVDAGLIVLGGCCISDDNPNWQCYKCGKQI